MVHGTGNKLELIANWMAYESQSVGPFCKSHTVSESQGRAEHVGIGAGPVALAGPAPFQKSKPWPLTKASVCGLLPAKAHKSGKEGPGGPRF